eukprot:3023122-Rhodomonas_salina.1
MCLHCRRPAVAAKEGPCELVVHLEGEGGPAVDHLLLLVQLTPKVSRAVRPRVAWVPSVRLDPDHECRHAE